MQGAEVMLLIKQGPVLPCIVLSEGAVVSVATETTQTIAAPGS